MIQNKIKFYTYGNASKISIFEYRSYQKYINKFFKKVKDPKKADIIIFSHIEDVAKDIPAFQKCQNNAKAILFSEEPLWDNSWSNSIQYENTKPFVQDSTGKFRVDFEIINYFNSNIYEYKFFPHFLTTNLQYVKNYYDIFNNLDSSNIINLFNKKKYDVTGLFSRRDVIEPNQFDFSDNKEGKCLNSIKYGLSDLFIDNKLNFNCDFFGHGNSEIPDVTDDTIYDGYTFHRKKVDWCLKNSKFLFAIENTLQKDYVTEKVFDAICSLSIPIYFQTHQGLDIKGINLNNYTAKSIDEFYDFCVDEIQSIDVKDYISANLELSKSIFEDFKSKMDFEIHNRARKAHDLVCSLL